MARLTAGVRLHAPSAPPAVPAPAPGALLVLRRRLFDLGNVAQVNGRAVHCPHDQIADFLGRSQRLAGYHSGRLPAFAHAARRKSAIGLARRFDHIAERNPVQRKFGGVRRDPHRLLLPADDESQADIVDLGDLGPQPAGIFAQSLVGPCPRRARFGRQRQHHDRHIADPPHGHLRRGNAHRDAVHIGIELLVDPGRGVFWVAAHQEARGHHHAVVFGLGIDMLHPVDALDDRLERLGHHFHGIAGREARRGNANVHHRHRDLRLFFARDRQRGNDAHQNRGKQQQRSQGRIDRRPGEPPGYPKRSAGAHLPAFLTSTSPAERPESISTMPVSPLGAVCTGTLAALPALSTAHTVSMP